jgi:hypothetical protein
LATRFAPLPMSPANQLSDRPTDWPFGLLAHSSRASSAHPVGIQRVL